jgi:hypothetical protein
MGKGRQVAVALVRRQCRASWRATREEGRQLPRLGKVVCILLWHHHQHRLSLLRKLVNVAAEY